MKGQDTPHAFRWGNGFYHNLAEGDTVSFRGQTIHLLQMQNHYNQIKVGEDTVWVKVSRRSLPVIMNGIRFFIADNKKVKALSAGHGGHGLLEKDVLLCLSDFRESLLDHNRFIFPVSFTDGYMWSMEENSYMFSWSGSRENGDDIHQPVHPGLDFGLDDARGLEKHWLVAVEDTRVVWIKTGMPGQVKEEASVLLESLYQPGIYYIYEHLYEKNIGVKEGRTLVRGEPVGTVWGDDQWGHLHFAVVRSDTIPSYNDRFENLVNGFPQIYELYYGHSAGYSKTFSKGRIYFGRPSYINNNQKNVAAYESYTGKGWLLGRWNPAGKVEWITENSEGNARLGKVLFEGTAAQCRNPEDYYDYEINVRNGVYRIRARIGDLTLPSWQKPEFEGVSAGTFMLESGEFEWTTERVVEVKDGKLSVRIFIDPENTRPAGLSQIVFQRAY